MNKSESKYFNTAIKMDEAFLDLLGKKDFEFITVKEICQKAGVNRSTFYLHYETLGDLLSESAEYMNMHFLENMNQDSHFFVSKIESCSVEELYLITPEYLTPYLEYVSKYRRLFRTVMNNASVLGLQKTYLAMFEHVFSPIMKRYGVDEKDRGYMLGFYLNGIISVIKIWLDNDCAEPVEYIVSLVQKCIPKK